MTFYLAYKLISWIDVSVNRLIPPEFRPDNYLPYSIPGLGLVLLIVALILIGMFAAGFLGKFFLSLGEWIVYKMPLISSVYSLLKQVFQTFLSNKNNAFSKVVLLEYPRKGIWILGFVSSETQGEVKDKLGREMLNIFIPTTPNPTFSSSGVGCNTRRFPTPSIPASRQLIPSGALSRLVWHA